MRSVSGHRDGHMARTSAFHRLGKGGGGGGKAGGGHAWPA